MNREKQLCEWFDALMAILSEFIVRRLAEEALTTNSYRQRRELIEKISFLPFADLKKRLTTWGLDEKIKPDGLYRMCSSSSPFTCLSGQLPGQMDLFLVA